VCRCGGERQRRSGQNNPAMRRLLGASSLAGAKSLGESIFARLINAPRSRGGSSSISPIVAGAILRESSREIYERHTCNWSIEVIAPIAGTY